MCSSRTERDAAAQGRAVVVAHDRLREIVARILAAAGASQADGRVVADHLVDSNLSGHDSHGVGMLPFYVRGIASGVLDPRAHATIEDRGGGILAADGQRGFGQVVAREAIAAAMLRARAVGVGLVGLRNAFHVGRIGTYGEQAATEGFLSIHFVNVIGHRPLVAPFRGSDPRFSTNPFCVTLPRPGGAPPLVLDFATSIVALGKTRVALNRGKTMDDGTLIDAQGRSTNDPAVMWRDPKGAILPFGLHKGYGLALMCELLAGAVAGAGTSATIPAQDDRIDNGMFSLVIDPARFAAAERIEREVASAVEFIKASPPADPELPVLVAGEPELAARAERSKAGIPIEIATWEELRAAASSVGIAL
jgi:uncharacterized oxidoreductase